MPAENKDKRLQYLFHQYVSNHITEEEYIELWNILNMESARKSLSEELQWLWEKVKTHSPVISSEVWDKKIDQLINDQEKPDSFKEEKHRHRIKPLYIGWAAALIVLLVVGKFYFNPERTTLKKMATSPQREDILPGGNRAVLTLSNGSVITLDSSAQGLLAHQGNASISKPANGVINYKLLNDNSASVVYNTLSTPRGGQYQIVLPDGTKVWLNSASSLHFPTSFNGNKREVQMTGEAYFEVASNASKPFLVSVDGMTVKVLGTHFNIMAYDDANVIKTTLLSGSVSVHEAGASELLVPGEQAQITKGGKMSLMENANTGEAIAWKNGLFWFQENTIREVMREISRWYNVDVVINGDIPQHFTGSMPRNVPVSKIFEILQETGRINFEIKDNKIIVSP